ncbi:MAG: Rv2175c family DNA-binding protein [Nakamurella sp.]
MSNTPTFVALPDISDLMDSKITRVHQLLNDRHLVEVRRDGIRMVPAEFVLDRQVVKSLPATITLLTDAGFTDEEIIDWLFTADDLLPGRPIDALRENRGTEIKRRAQAAGF